MQRWLLLASGDKRVSFWVSAKVALPSHMSPSSRIGFLMKLSSANNCYLFSKDWENEANWRITAHGCFSYMRIWTHQTLTNKMPWDAIKTIDLFIFSFINSFIARSVCLFIYCIYLSASRSIYISIFYYLPVYLNSSKKFGNLSLIDYFSLPLVIIDACLIPL